MYRPVTQARNNEFGSGRDIVTIGDRECHLSHDRFPTVSIGVFFFFFFRQRKRRATRARDVLIMLRKVSIVKNRVATGFSIVKKKRTRTPEVTGGRELFDLSSEDPSEDPT